jgi:hypothetical protein
LAPFLAGCARLSVQVAALRFAEALGEADQAALREASSARLNAEVWDHVDEPLLQRLKQTKKSDETPRVEVVRTDVDGGRAAIFLRIDDKGARVDLVHEDGWRVDDIIAEGHSLRRLAGCYIVMVQFADAIGRKDIPAMRRAATDDLARRVIDHLRERHFVMPSPASPSIAQERFEMRERDAEFVFRVDDKTYTCRLKREEGAWKLDDVIAPGGSLKLMAIAGLASERLLRALGDADRDAIRASVTEEFWGRMSHHLTEEFMQIVRSSRGSRIDGNVTVSGDGRTIRLSIAMIEIQVVEDRVDDIRWSGVSIADHLDIAAAAIAFANALTRSDREALSALSSSPAWKTCSDEELAESASMFSQREWKQGEVSVAVQGDAATVSAPDVVMKLKKSQAGWVVDEVRMELEGRWTTLPREKK